MCVAVIISTHGSSSTQLLKTAEMIIGKQNNVKCVDFLSGENIDKLINKYKISLKELEIKSGVLFLVDIFGGSPFNAANQLCCNKKNYEIISGINIPMLIEVFIQRDDKINFSDLIDSIIETGKNSIQISKINKKNTIKISNNNTIANKNTHSDILLKHKTNHMKICLVRIDDRLIHGQVVTGWAKNIKINRIIVINDEIEKDEIRRTLLTQVSPPGITSHVISIEKAVRVYNNPKYCKDRVIFLFTNPSDVLKLVQLGIKIRSVNIGGMSFQKGKIKISNTIFVNEKDITSFNNLNKLGIELEVRQVPNDRSKNMMDLLQQIK